MMKPLRCLPGVAVCLLVMVMAGCATITTGTSQSIAVESDPAGANCSLTRERAVLGKVTTPASLTIKRSGQPIVVECKKDGYEDSRTVMNARAEGATYANAIVGGWVGMMVDQGTGANSRYDASVRLELTAMSEADRNYAEARKAQAAVVPATPMMQQATVAARTAPSGAPAGPYDGTYAGTVDVLQTNVNPPIPHPRQFNIRVVNGIGTGTVKHVLCDQPGEVFFMIDGTGNIKGKANTQNTSGCTQRMTMLEGRAEGSEIKITLQLKGNPVLSLTRSAGSDLAAPVPTAAPTASGPNDGEYSGGLELGAGDLRQVWLKVVGAKGTGNVRYASCPHPGLISIDIAADGSVSGSADLLSGPACTPKKATVKGQINGAQLAIAVAADDGRVSREFVINKRSRGAGVDD